MRLFPTYCSLLLVCVFAAQSLNAQFFDEDDSLPSSDPSNFAALESTSLNSLIDQLRATVGEDGTGDQPERTSWRGMIETFERIYAIDALFNLVVPSNRSPGRWIPAIDAINNIIEVMPQTAFDAWNTMFGTKADVEFAFAIQRNDEEELLRIGAVFLFARGGINANLWLATQAHEAGELSTAVLCDLRAVRGQVHAKQVEEAGFSFLRACHGMALLGRGEELSEIISQYASLRTVPVVVNGKSSLIGTVAEGYLELSRRDNGSSLSSAGVAANGTGAGAMGSISSLDNETWPAIKLPTPNSEPYALQGYNGRRGSPFNYMFYYAPEAPQLVPVLYNNAILVNCGEHLACVDLFTGRTKWEPVSLPAPPDAFHVNEIDPNLFLTATGWEGMAFASLENPLSYELHDPKPDPRYGYLVPFYPLPKRSLTAVDIASGQLLWRLGGSYRVPTNEEGLSELESACSTLSFSHSIVVGSTLYALAELRANQTELMLIAISPESGKPLWKVSLCQGQSENNMFGNAAREAMPAPLIHMDGKVIVQSNLGGVIAVNVSARNVSWVKQYDAMPRPYTRRQRTNYRKRTFLNANPICTVDKDGRRLVIAAPTDARSIICLDFETGEQVWIVDNIEPPQRSAYEVGGSTDPGPSSLIGAYRGSVYVGRESTLKRIDLENGTVQQDLSAAIYRTNGTPAMANPLAGRAAITTSQILWPGRAGLSFFEIAEDGTISTIASSKVDPSFSGNLVVRDGVLAVITGNSYLGPRGNDRYTPFPTLSVRFDPNQTLRQIEEDVRKSPNDLTARLRLAQLADRLGLESGYTTSQVDHLLKEIVESKPLSGKDEDARIGAKRLLFDRFVQRAIDYRRINDRNTSLKALASAREWASDAGQKRDIFKLEEDDLLRAGDVAGLIELLQHLLKEKSGFSLTLQGEAVGADLYAHEKLLNLLASVGRVTEAAVHAQWLESRFLDDGNKEKYGYIVRRFDFVLQENGRGAYSDIDQSGLSQMNAELTPNELLTIARRFPHGETAMKALGQVLASSESLENKKVLSDTAELLDLLAERPAVVQAYVDLLRVYQDTERRIAALLLYGKLSLCDGNHEVVWKGAKRTLASLLETEQKPTLPQDPSLSSPKALLPVSAEPKWSQRYHGIVDGRETPPNLRVIDGTLQVGDYIFMTCVNTDQGSGLLALDAATGERMWISEGVYGNCGAYLLNETVVVVDYNMMTCLSLSEGKRLWQLPLAGNYRALSWRDGLALVTTQHNRDMANLFAVSAIDCEEGRFAWSVEYDYAQYQIAYAFFADTEVILVERTLANAFFLDNATGRETRLQREGNGFSQPNTQPVMAGGRVWFSGYDRMTRKSVMMSLHVSSRTFEEDTPLQLQSVNRLIATETQIIAINHLGAAEAFDLQTGKSLWTTEAIANRLVQRIEAHRDALVIVSTGSVQNEYGRDYFLSIYSTKDGHLIADQIVVTQDKDQPNQRIISTTIELVLFEDAACVAVAPSLGIPASDGSGSLVRVSGRVELKVVRLSDAATVLTTSLTEKEQEAFIQVTMRRTPWGLLVAAGGDVFAFGKK